MPQHLPFRSSLLAVLLLSGCTSATEEPETPEIPARPPLEGELLISQLYTSGAKPAGGTDHYYSDQFIELVNASETPLDLSGVGVADVFGVSGEINSGLNPDSYRDRRPNKVVMSTLWRIPAGVTLAPAETLIIAHDGSNHRPFSELDLSSADFEAFVAEFDRDEDSPTVANLETETYNGGYDWLMTVFGPSVVIIDADTSLNQLSSPYGPLPTAPIEAVLDGVDTVMDADSGDYKRLPDAVDAGFAWHDGPYTGTALHRKISNDMWQDTNDSSADFEVGAPSPTLPTETGGVFGDPWLELGTGTTEYEPLEDDDPIAIVHGPQGGWHLDVSVWFDGFGPAGVTLGYEAINTDAERMSFITEARLFEENVLVAEEGWHRVGDRIVLAISDPQEVVDGELILRVTAALGEQTWSDERRILVIDE